MYLQTVDHSNNCKKESWPAHAAAEQGKHGRYNIVVWPWHTTIPEVRTKLCFNDLPSKIQLQSKNLEYSYIFTSYWVLGIGICCVH